MHDAMFDSPEKRFVYTETLLRHHFNTDFIALNDESEAHLGHAGAEHGASHYEVLLARHALTTFGTLIKLHRAVYQVLANLIPQDIHALKIRIV